MEIRHLPFLLVLQEIRNVFQIEVEHNLSFQTFGTEQSTSVPSGTNLEATR